MRSEHPDFYNPIGDKNFLEYKEMYEGLCSHIIEVLGEPYAMSIGYDEDEIMYHVATMIRHDKDIDDGDFVDALQSIKIRNKIKY